jgi:hypothetical protein
MSSQPSSPLFTKLPRELRQLVYEFYSYEPNGYFHNPTTNQLRCRSEGEDGFKPPCLALMYTCKQAAAEMAEVPLRVNTITFTSADTGITDMSSYRGVKSRAGRFHCLLFQVHRAKKSMLLCAAKCVTPILDLVKQKYPTVGPFLDGPFIESRFQDGLRGIWVADAAAESQGADAALDFIDALQYTLELASTHPEFHDLASRTFDPEADTSMHAGDTARHFFMRVGALDAVLAWNPVPWTVPTENELLRMEAYLEDPEPQCIAEPETFGDIYAKCKEFNWYFSATALAINFLETRLSTGQQKDLRNVVLRDDFKSVSNPHVHARGLLPYLRNPTLHIEARAGLWANMLPPGFKRMFEVNMFRNGPDSSTRIYKGEALYGFGTWLCETAAIASSQEVSSHNFSVVFDGHSDASIMSIWTAMKELAGLQEAMIECYRRSDPNYTFPAFDESGVRPRRLYDAPMPCFLPNSFYQKIKEMVLRTPTSIFRFDGDPGQLWDLEQLITERQHWSQDDWRKEWRATIIRRLLPLPGHNGWEGIRQKYRQAPA